MVEVWGGGVRESGGYRGGGVGWGGQPNLISNRPWLTSVCRVATAECTGDVSILLSVLRLVHFS